MNHRSTLVPAFVLVALVILMASPGAAVSSLQLSAHPGISAPQAPSVLAASAASGTSLHPHPLITCPMPPDVYHSIDGVWPLTPKQASQAPCPYIAQDGVHGSLFSNAPHSGENFRVPVFLPTEGKVGQEFSYGAFYVGDVLTGDPHSAYHQSYAEASFTPLPWTGGVNYSVDVALFSFVNSSTFTGGSCPGVSMELSWNYSFWCEIDEMGDGNGANFGNISGGTWVNVTFDGVRNSGVGTHLWVNTSSLTVVDHVFNGTQDNLGGTGLTGNWTFSPDFGISCPLNCILNWSMPLGNGVGFDVCPQGPGTFSVCSTFNQDTWSADPPVQFGSPEFFLNGSYSGDYRYFAPSSESGVCNPNANPGIISVCFNFGSNGGTGYYPIFTFNGTELNFGTTWPWTQEDFGGVTFQYLANGYPVLLTPFWVDHVKNDSRGGFVAPGIAVNVSARVMDLGTVRSATLNYQLGSGAYTPIPMTRISGGASDGIYAATIPGGPNGPINYTVTGINNAGATFVNGTYHLQRGPLPLFNLTLTTAPPSCGSIVFNGTDYPNNSTITTLPGTFSLLGIACYPYIFGFWNATPGLFPGPASVPAANLTVSNSGTLVQQLIYIRPHDTVHIATSPSTCGSINLNGSTFIDGDTVSLFDAIPVSLSYASACSQDGSFAGWTFSGNFTILGPVFTPAGNGTLTANFVPSGSADSLVFYTSPGTCGGVLFQGAGYTNTESINVLPGTYTLGDQACPHFGFRNFSSNTPSITTTNTSVTVTGGGWVRATDQHLTEITVASNPPACGLITIDGKSYRNGNIDVVGNNTTHSVSQTACAGYSFFGFNTTGGLHLFGSVLVANGSGTLLAVYQFGAQKSFVGFVTDPPKCGSILFQGLTFHNSNFTFVQPGAVATVVASLCPNYGFVRWLTTGGITIVGNTAYLNGTGGSIEAVFRPLVQLFLTTSPLGCGSIILNGISYSNNATLLLPIDDPFTLTAVPCAHYGLTQWENSTSAEISGNLLFLTGSAFLTAQFDKVRYGVTVVTDPANCGAVKIGGQQLSNGTKVGLFFGVYGIQPVFCLGDHLQAWVISGNLTISGALLTVNGSGTVTGIYRPTPPTVSLLVPSSSLAGQAVGLLAQVGVLVPPFNYTYSWSFGDGVTVVTPGNITSHVYANPGTYTASVTVTDPYHRMATQNATLKIIPASAATGAGIPIWSLYVAGGILGVVVVAIIVGVVLGRRPPKDDEDGGAAGLEPPATTPVLEEPSAYSLPPLQAPKNQGPEP